MRHESGLPMDVSVILPMYSGEIIPAPESKPLSMVLPRALKPPQPDWDYMFQKSTRAGFCKPFIDFICLENVICFSFKVPR